MSRQPQWGHRYVAEVCEEMWRLEKEHNLFSIDIIGVNVWSLIRMPVYYQTATASGFFDDPHPNVVTEDEESQSPANSFLWNHYLKSREFTLKKLLTTYVTRNNYGRTVIVTHGRKQNGIDIYTHALIKSAGKKAVVLDRTPSEDSRYPDLLSFRLKFNKTFSRPRTEPINVEDLEPIHKAIETLESKFEVDLSVLRDSIEQRIIANARQQQHYIRLFNALATKRLYLTNSYFSNSLVAAAKKCNVRVIELQHGFISKFHMGYSYPDVVASPMLPDEMWCFGKFWIDDTGLKNHLKTRVVGAPYVQELAELEPATRTSAQRIVITSQGAIGQHLLPVGVQIAQGLPDAEVIFRLHPSESLEDMEALLANSGVTVPSNFSLNAKTPNIFSLMKSADVVVGVFSTTLLEGMALGARTMIVALPGFEYMDAIVERGDASIARTADDVIDAIRNAPHCEDPSYYYANPVKLL